MDDLIKSGMIGLMIGDALGVPVEFMDREQIAGRPGGKVTDMEGDGTFHMPPGTWSDDSSMALATLASIREKNEIDLDDIMNKFVSWVDDGQFTPFGLAFDIGSTCNEAIASYALTKDINNCGVTGEYANGNGALMRILPVCIYWYELQQKRQEDITCDAIESIEKVASLTHNHKRSCIACGIYYFLIKEIADNKRETRNTNLSLAHLIQQGIDTAFRYYGKDKSYHDELECYDELLDIDVLSEYQEDEISGSGYVVDSLMASVWCLITTNSYRECVLAAVNLGEDTDTTAAIAGGLAGLYYGTDNIPAEWRNMLQGKEILDSIIHKKSKNPK